MSEDRDALLTELESVTREMTAGGVPLERLTELCLRRGELLTRAMRTDPGESCLERLQAISLAGAEAGNRVLELRESIRREIAELKRGRMLLGGLASVLPPDGHCLDTQG
jgi:hypothetical protein